MRNKADLLTRFRDMAIGWGSVGIVYTLGSLYQGEGAVLPESALDRLIPFNTVSIWLYLSFFLYIPYAYFTINADRLLWLRRSMQCCALLSTLVFLLWPTTLTYPDYVAAFSGSLAGDALVRILLWGDSPQNCLPSLHAALTLLCTWALLDSRHRARSALAGIACACICFSVIQLRRHLSVDVAAGLVAGLACGWLCRQQLPWQIARPDCAVPSRKGASS